MNTNEFRHPKERLQNLSSRHKVSENYFSFIVLFPCALMMRGCWKGAEVRRITGGDGTKELCAYLRCAGWQWSSSPCRNDVHWGLLKLCRGLFEPWVSLVICMTCNYNFAKICPFISCLYPPYSFYILHTREIY